MKRRIIGVGVIVIILIILITIVLKREDIYETYKTNQIRKDSINNINGKFSKRTSPYTIDDYERYHKSVEELNHYDITNIIEPYIKLVEDGVRIYIEKEAGIEKEYENIWNYSNRKEDLEKGKDIQMEIVDYSDCVCYDMTDEDVENLNNGTFTEKLIEKLKTCLDYEEKDGKIQWQINDTEDKTIELPYNCYIEYKAYHREDNKDFKKAVDVVLGENFKLKKKDNRVIVKYETPNGNIKDEKTHMYYSIINGREYYKIPLYDLLVINTDTLAEAILKSHTCDRIKKEEGIREHQKWLEELTRRYSYDDPDIP